MNATTSPHLSPREALVAAMVLMSAADGSGISGPELRRMNRLVAELPAFGGSDPREIETATEVVARLLGESDGLDRAMTLIRDSLQPRLRETAYLLACDIAAADGEVSQDELRLLQDLRIALDLDRLIAGAIERAARARYQVI